jgi:phosphatidate phosphatase APP1
MSCDLKFNQRLFGIQKLNSLFFYYFGVQSIKTILFSIKKIILPFLFHLKNAFSNAKLWFGIKIGLVNSLMILPYKGFGNSHEIYFLGRVLRDRGITSSNLEDGKWKNFTKMYKRFMSWEIPGVRVMAEFQGLKQIASTDEEGYFEIRLRSENPFQIDDSWQEVSMELLDKVVKKQGKVMAKNRVFIPLKTKGFGVISDIDDTIVPTGATRLWTMLRTTFLGNAHTRLPFPGVAEFYQALAKGKGDQDRHPFFYVSSSPWNLYDFLMEFLDVHGIPKGPLMLRDLGLSREQFISGSHWEHKLLQVEKIFEVEKHLQFILIGDSGQHDPEIYLQAVKDYPGRVKMIYIRDIKSSRHPAMEAIQEELKNLGVPMLLIKDTVEAANHAAAQGWIDAASVKNIKVASETP